MYLELWFEVLLLNFGYFVVLDSYHCLFLFISVFNKNKKMNYELVDNLYLNAINLHHKFLSIAEKKNSRGV